MRQLRLSVILGVDGCRYIDSGHTGKHGLDLSTENFLRRGEIKIHIKLVAAGGHLAIEDVYKRQGKYGSAPPTGLPFSRTTAKPQSWENKIM